jgi:Ice-binding-like
MVRTHTFTMLTSRLAVMVLFAALFSAVPSQAALAAEGAPDLGTAGSFAVLAGGAVTCTNSTINGNVGLGLVPGTIFTNTNCTVLGSIHQGDSAAKVAYAAFLKSYASFSYVPCGTVLTGTLDGQVLAPGVYCFDAAATLTGTLTLCGPSNGIWIFKIGTSGTGALTATDFTVVMDTTSTGCAGQACNVYWWVQDAATLTRSTFLGTILAGADITITGGTFTGDLFAGGTGTTKAPTGAVTLTGTTTTACNLSGNNGRPGCNQGVGNGPEGCDPGNSNNHNPSNDELAGAVPGSPGRKH